MLTEMQRTMLRMAAQAPVANRVEQINEVTRLIKAQSPEKFFHDTEKKLDPYMAKRVFINQPYSLMPDQYLRHVRPLGKR